jgi:hypothetical protein
MANQPRTELEDQLERLTRDFVVSLVAAIRNASFADVASLSARYTEVARDASPRRRRQAPVAPPQVERPATAALPEARRVRQTADKRAELSERVMKTLRGAGSALGVRALSSALGVSPDILAAPLRELRDKGLIQKHGDKRATTYSA